MKVFRNGTKAQKPVKPNYCTIRLKSELGPVIASSNHPATRFLPLAHLFWAGYHSDSFGDSFTLYGSRSPSSRSPCPPALAPASPASGPAGTPAHRPTLLPPAPGPTECRRAVFAPQSFNTFPLPTPLLPPWSFHSQAQPCRPTARSPARPMPPGRAQQPRPLPSPLKTSLGILLILLPSHRPLLRAVPAGLRARACTGLHAAHSISYCIVPPPLGRGPPSHRFTRRREEAQSLCLPVHSPPPPPCLSPPRGDWMGQHPCTRIEQCWGQRPIF